MPDSNPPLPTTEQRDAHTLARQLVERGFYEEAVELYLVALRFEPGSHELRNELTAVFDSQHQQQLQPLSSLSSSVQKQVRRNSIDAAHFLGLAHLYAEKHNFLRAVECLEVAKSKDDVGPAPFKLHGKILFDRRDFEGAAGELSKALRFNPFDRQVAELLGRAELERQSFHTSLQATLHALLLLPKGHPAVEHRLRKRIRTLKEFLGWDKSAVLEVFHERQDTLRTAHERLQWHRERFEDQRERPDDGFLETTAEETETEGAESRLDIANRMRRISQLSHLKDDAVFQLGNIVTQHQVEQGAVVLSKGDENTDIYILESGTLGVSYPTPYGPYPLATIQPGSLFGEANFVAPTQRVGNVEAKEDCEFLRIDGVRLKQMIDASPEFGVPIYWAFWHGLANRLRVTNERLRTFFEPGADGEASDTSEIRDPSPATPTSVNKREKVSVFREQGVSGAELRTLATFAAERRYPPGTHIFREGDPGDEMFVIVEGRVVLSKQIPGAGEEALAVLKRGDFFGDMAIIDGETRSADARVYRGPVVVLAIARETVQKVLSLDPQASLAFLRLLCRLLARRLREINQKVITWSILAGQHNSSLTG